MRLVRICAVFFLFTFILTGCWDIKTIQDINYVNAIGIDYKDGKYIVYNQIIDTASIAKHESGNLSQPGLESTGHMEGETINEAILKLNQTSQQRIYLGHVSALLLTESALRRGISVVTDSLLRFRENRFRMRTFVTKESIDEVFATPAFHNLSPLSSILHQPMEKYEQLSSIRPFYLFDVIHNYREPGNTFLLPNLSITKEIWNKNDQPEGKLFVDGAFAIREDNGHKWFSEKDLRGKRWLENNTSIVIIPLVEEGKTVATISVTNPKSTIQPIVSDNEVSFQLNIHVKAIMQEMIEPLDEATFEEDTVKAIRDEIERTFNIGQKAGIDIYALEHELYRKNFQDWSRFTDNGSHKLQKIRLESIEVKVKLIHTGMFNTNEKKKDY
jgi:spore germination protein KC